MLKKLFTDKSHNTLIQFFRYAIVGGVAFIVDLGSFLFFTEVFHLHYLWSNVIGFCAGLVTNYILSILWVFPVKMMKNRGLEFAVFGIIGVIGLGLATLFLWLFTDFAHIDYRYSKIIAMALVLLWNFLARKYVLFRKAKKQDKAPGEETT